MRWRTSENKRLKSAESILKRSSANFFQGAKLLGNIRKSIHFQARRALPARDVSHPREILYPMSPLNGRGSLYVGAITDGNDSGIIFL